MALIATLLAVSFTAQPGQLVLGHDAGADLTVHAPAGATVTLSTSVGSVSTPRREGDVWTARFSPPSVHSPAVAMILLQAEVDGARELAWLSLPLSGADTMEIETRPGSSVMASVAGTSIGPVVADKSGTARLSMVVPPGVAMGTLHITDKLGNKSEKPLDLEPPPFSRVRMASRSMGATTVAPAELEIFVIKPDGTPDDDAKVELIATDGEAVVRKRVGPGIYLGRYLAPTGKTGSVHLEAKANGQVTALDLPVTEAHVLIAQPFWRSSLVSERPWSVSVGPIVGVGASFDGANEGTILIEAAVRLEVLPVELVFDFGPSYFSEITQPSANPPNTDRVSSRSWKAQFGLRLGRELVPDLDGHATLLLGLQNQQVDLTSSLAGGGGGSRDAYTPRLAFAIGASFVLGYGRVLGQVQFDSSASRIAALAGSLSGVQVMLGYLITVR